MSESEEMKIKIDTEKIKEEYEKSEETINEFCIDLTTKMLSYSEDDFFVNKNVNEKIFTALCKKKKSNVILYGDSGVGKTAIVECLAYLISANKVPLQFVNKHILSLNVSKIISGARYRGDLEERLNNIIEKIKKTGRDILFIDEIHTILTTGGVAESSALSISDILKPILARDDFRCIGTTTTAEYEKFFKYNDEALTRRFEWIKIEEPTKEEVFNILMKTKSQYENFHSILYDKEIIHEIIDLADKYIPQRKFPDKAFDIIDKIGAYTRIKKIKETEQIKSILENIYENKENYIKMIENENYGKALEIKDKIEVYEECFIREKKRLIEKSEKNVVERESLYEIVGELAHVNKSRISRSRIYNKSEIVNDIKMKFHLGVEICKKIIAGVEKEYFTKKKEDKTANVLFLNDKSRMWGVKIFKLICNFIFPHAGETFFLFNMNNIFMEYQNKMLAYENIITSVIHDIENCIYTNNTAIFYFENIEKNTQEIIISFFEKILGNNMFLSNNGTEIRCDNIIFVFNIAFSFGTDGSVQSLLGTKNIFQEGSNNLSWIYEIPVVKKKYSLKQFCDSIIAI